MGRINSVLELTLTPSLPLLPGPEHRPTYSTSQQGTEKGRDCITAVLSWTKVAENGTIKERTDSEKEENCVAAGRNRECGRQGVKESGVSWRRHPRVPLCLFGQSFLGEETGWVHVDMTRACFYQHAQMGGLSLKCVVHTKHTYALLCTKCRRNCAQGLCNLHT